MAGRRPKPLALKEAEGNPGKRNLNYNEPRARNVRPKPPEHIKANPLALVEWKRLVRILWPTGVLTEAESDVLALYCTAYCQWVEATKEVTKHGMVVKSPNNFPIQNPYLGVANQAAKQMRSLLIELGMTPASRSRIAVERAGGDSFDDFLAGAYTVTHEEPNDE